VESHVLTLFALIRNLVVLGCCFQFGVLKFRNDYAAAAITSESVANFLNSEMSTLPLQLHQNLLQVYTD
jgi:hypothetical protein